MHAENGSVHIIANNSSNKVLQLFPNKVLNYFNHVHC